MTLPNSPIIARNSTQSIVFTTNSSATLDRPYKNAPPIHIRSPVYTTQALQNYQKYNNSKVKLPRSLFLAGSLFSSASAQTKQPIPIKQTDTPTM